MTYLIKAVNQTFTKLRSSKDKSSKFNSTSESRRYTKQKDLKYVIKIIKHRYGNKNVVFFRIH